MATTEAKRTNRGWVVDWRGTSAEWQGLRADLTENAAGVVTGWQAFHLPGDVVRCLVACKGIPELANQ